MLQDSQGSSRGELDFFLFDNEKKYNKNVLPIMLPRNFESCKLAVRVFIHPDECCGNICGNAHFAV